MILVTGGAGYIGSHTLIELISTGYDVVVLDNLSNSSSESLTRVAKIVNLESFVVSGEWIASPSTRNGVSKLTFVEGDIRDQDLLRRVFATFDIEAVIHFAGLKAVSESVVQPLRYYDNNVSGSLALFNVMMEFNCKRLVFSSSATVYGDSVSVPVKESSPLSTVNPYGTSKLMVENILRDLYAGEQSWSIGLLRYFNPVGAHESGLIGEDPSGIPNNLMPFVSQVAIGLRDKLKVFGGDYPSKDGTGIRDYIHVVDLAKGHVKALIALHKKPDFITVNLGTGRGYSVLDMVKAFERVSGKVVPYEIVARRTGDVAQSYADSSYAQEVLGWKAEFDIDRMCEDAWRWQSLNPKGYKQ